MLLELPLTYRSLQAYVRPYTTDFEVSACLPSCPCELISSRDNSSDTATPQVLSMVVRVTIK